jgi:hypothetical protein
MAKSSSGKVLLTKEIIGQIKGKLDELEGKEVDQGALFGLSFSGELSDQALSGVVGGVTAAWSIEIRRH